MPTPARTSLESIVAAARALIESDDVDALTMQRVAAAVGVRAPSLYKRVRDRDELIRLVVRDAVGQLTERLEAAAMTGDAAGDLRALAHAVRAFAHRHPNAYRLIFSPGTDARRPDAESLAAASATLLRTTATLAGPDHALEAARTVVAWVHGFLNMELAGAFRLGGDVDAAFAFGIERLTVALAAPASRPKTGQRAASPPTS